MCPLALGYRPPYYYDTCYSPEMQAFLQSFSLWRTLAQQVHLRNAARHPNCSQASQNCPSKATSWLTNQLQRVIRLPVLGFDELENNCSWWQCGKGLILSLGLSLTLSSRCEMCNNYTRAQKTKHLNDCDVILQWNYTVLAWCAWGGRVWVWSSVNVCGANVSL